jgi:hypothetical protein
VSQPVVEADATLVEHADVRAIDRRPQQQNLKDHPIIDKSDFKTSVLGRSRKNLRWLQTGFKET